MKKEGELPPEWDSPMGSGMGFRYRLYAITIIRNSIAPMSFVDDEAVLRHARKKDWYLALFLVHSSTVLMVVGSLVYFYMQANF